MAMMTGVPDTKTVDNETIRNGDCWLQEYDDGEKGQSNIDQLAIIDSNIFITTWKRRVSNDRQRAMPRIQWAWKKRFMGIGWRRGDESL